MTDRFTLGFAAKRVTRESPERIDKIIKDCVRQVAGAGMPGVAVIDVLMPYSDLAPDSKVKLDNIERHVQRRLAICDPGSCLCGYLLFCLSIGWDCTGGFDRVSYLGMESRVYLSGMTTEQATTLLSWFDVLGRRATESMLSEHMALCQRATSARLK
ncbi:MAG: hypothetical protein ABIZ70_09075 [Gemmatimonadales bacterium]